MTVEAGAVHTPTRLSHWLDRFHRWRRSATWLLAVDLLAVMIAASLPWSTSATSILVLLWVIVVAPTIDWERFMHDLAHPACALPALFAGARRPWHPMGGRPLGGALVRDQAGGEAAADPIPSLPLPAKPTRLLGFDRLPRLMHAVDDPVLDRAVRPRPEACAHPLRRRPRQELYRPEPGIRALRLRAGPAGADRVALEKMEAGRWLSCTGAGLHRQHAIRSAGADRADLHGGAAGIVRLASSQPAFDVRITGGRHRRRLADLDKLPLSAPAYRRHRRRISGAGHQRDRVDGAATDLLAQVDQVPCRGPAARPRHRLDQGTIYARCGRADRAGGRDRQQPAQPDACRRGAVGAARRHAALRNVAQPSPAVHRTDARGMDRACRRRAKRRQLTPEFASVRFPPRLDLRAGRWHCRRHGNACGKISAAPSARPRR